MSEKSSIDRHWRFKAGLSVLWLASSLLLGGLSVFILFAKSFTSADWGPLIFHAILISAFSALLGLRAKTWRSMLFMFFLPHLFLFVLLIKGSFEKGDWIPNAILIVMIAGSIFIPAVLFSRKQAVP